MSKQKFNIKLDFFGGFYESHYENSDTEYYAINEEKDWYNEENPGLNMEYDDFTFDYQRRRDDIIKLFVSIWNNYAPDVVKDVKFEHLWSPRFYNFNTDEIYADIKLAPNWISVFKQFMKDNHDKLKERIANDWTSYDGFMSFMSNNIDEWPDYLFNQMDERYIGSMITYMMLFDYLENNYRSNEKLYDVICYEVMEEIYDNEYISMTEEGEEKFKKYEEQKEISKLEPLLFSE